MVSTHLKNISQIGKHPPVGVNIKIFETTTQSKSENNIGIEQHSDQQERQRQLRSQQRRRRSTNLSRNKTTATPGVPRHTGVSVDLENEPANVHIKCILIYI